MICPSPMINGDVQTLATKLSQSAASEWGRESLIRNSNSTLHHIPDQIYLQIGFLMDDIVSVLELDTYYPHLDSNILYVSDPIVYSLNNGHGKSIIVGRVGENVLPFKSDILVIEGENLAVLPLADNEMNVTIGTQRCNLTSISMRQIVCQPPPYPPPPTDELGRRGPIDLPAVVLRIGNMRRHLGYLHYGNEDYLLNGFGYNSGNTFHDDGSSFGGQDDSSRFYHQNHPAFGYGNRFNSSNAINVELLIGILIFTGTVLAIISIIVLAAYKHKTTEAEREYKRIQLQMDTLENNVRSECKQAFAELQTDILQASGLFSVEEMHRLTLPTHDERTFLLRIFFASIPVSNWCEYSNYLTTTNANSTGAVNMNTSTSPYQTYNCSIDSSSNNRLQHPTRSLVGSLSQLFWNSSPYFICRDDDPDDRLRAQLPLMAGSQSDTYQQMNGSIGESNFYTLNNGQFADCMPNKTVIDQFEQLVLNRTFLLSLVNTLEQQKTFTHNDRIRFGSLLMLALLNKMEYAFDIIRQLLAQLINRFASTKHPNQLIRRTETVVETMLVDWLSICMFKYAKEVSSGPLFLLFSAIKHQIDKGPVDFVTGNSRFGFSIGFLILLNAIFFTRYSLCEERLLREHIEYKTITVLVFVDERLQQTLPSNVKSDKGPTGAPFNREERLRRRTSANRVNTKSRPSRPGSTLEEYQDDDGNGGGEHILPATTTTTTTTSASSTDYTDKDVPDVKGFQCRILDCDTITQVKAKIIDTLYRCVPYSERPQVNNVQLYWRCLKPKTMNPLNSEKLTTPNSSSAATTSTTVKNMATNGEYPNGESGSGIEIHQQQTMGKSSQPIASNSSSVVSTAAATASLLQDVYVTASLISNKNDHLDKIYNASRRSDVSMEMTDVLLEDYDHSTQILTANEAVWRRLNTITHYGIADGSVFFLCLRQSPQIPVSNQPPSSYYGDQSSLLYGGGGGKRSTGGYAESVTSSTRATNKMAGDEIFMARMHIDYPPPSLSSSTFMNRYGTNGNPSGGDIYDSEINDDEDRNEANYHLYESIPAIHSSIANDGSNYPMIREPIYGGSIGMEALYNLSNASSVQRSRSNYGQYNSSTPQQRYFTNESHIAPQSYEAYMYTRAANMSKQKEILYGVGGKATNTPTHFQTNSATLSPNNYSQRLLLQTPNYRIGTNSRRSFARNVYDRLSLFVKGTKRYNGIGKAKHCNRMAASSDVGYNEDIDQRHNIWHLVKPSSLIADCIIGASGSFLYDDANDLLSAKNRCNLRTMRQRRALRRRRAKPFGTNGKCSSSSQLAAAAAAALSASQMNLSQMNTGSMINTNTAANTPVIGSISRTKSPFSFLSTSNLFASLFQGNNQQQSINSSLSTLLLHKSIPEIYLTRLLTTKGTIQQYVDDFFETVFTVNDRLPIAVKWLFDFFDHQAMKNSINDSEIVHLWKSNR